MSVINQGGYSYVIHDSNLPGLSPLVVFLGGIGERGNIQALENFINSEYNNIVKAIDTGFILIAPLLPSGEWENHYVDAALDYATKVLPVRLDQITIMGVSLGGGGVWKYISHSLENAKKFNVAIPICGVGGWSNLKNVADAGLPVWAFHAIDDNVVGVGNTISAVDTINSFKPVIPAKKTIYPKGTFGTVPHYIWARVCDPDKSPGIEGEKVTIWQWMKQNTNIKHVAVTTITAPPPVSTPIPTTLKAIAEIKNLTATTATLDGSKSEGNPAYATWDVLKYPPKARFDIWPNGWNKGGLVINVNNLSAGEYLFELTVGKQAALSKTIMPVTVGATVSPIFKEFDIPAGKTHGIVREDKSVEFS